MAVPVIGQPQDQQFALDGLAPGDLELASSEFASSRPVYRYSVVPGGTHSPDELRDAIAKDAVVAAHYEKLDQSRLRAEVVPSDRYVHVSYRKGDRVYWSSKKLLLRKGETILTDGTTQVRARCGNCIAEQPAGPTSAEEPDVVEFDRLVDSHPSPGSAPSSVPDAALVAGTKARPEGLVAGSPSTGTTPASFGPGSLGSGSTGSFGPVGAGSPGIGGSASDPLVGATKAGAHEPGTPGPPDAGTPGNPGDNNPIFDLPLPVPPGSDGPFPPGNPFSPPGPDNPFPTGTDDPFSPPTDNPTGPQNPTPVPEPGTLLLVGGGAAEIIRRLRRRSAQR